MQAIDLFAGCGGLSLGLSQAGFTIVGAYEYWPAAAEVYRRNFPDHPCFEVDLADIESTKKHIRRHCGDGLDVIAGGPPCQDFSHAGRRVEGERADLTWAFAEAVTALRPTWFVMENVERARSSLAYARARELFLSSGYGLTERVLDASRCGVPQIRKRFFVVGGIGEKNGSLNASIDSNLSANRTTIREYLGKELEVEHYYRHPRNYNRRGVFSIDEPSPTVRGVNRPLPGGYPGHPNDSSPIRTGLRALTTSERSRIQTFPRDFAWIGSKTEMEQMIGNAVPVKLAEYVGKALMEHARRNRGECSSKLSKVG